MLLTVPVPEIGFALLNDGVRQFGLRMVSSEAVFQFPKPGVGFLYTFRMFVAKQTNFYIAVPAERHDYSFWWIVPSYHRQIL